MKLQLYDKNADTPLEFVCICPHGTIDYKEKLTNYSRFKKLML